MTRQEAIGELTSAIEEVEHNVRLTVVELGTDAWLCYSLDNTFGFQEITIVVMHEDMTCDTIGYYEGAMVYLAKNEPWTAVHTALRAGAEALKMLDALYGK